jgi:hypothetical protein
MHRHGNLGTIPRNRDWILNATSNSLKHDGGVMYVEVGSKSMPEMDAARSP